MTLAQRLDPSARPPLQRVPLIHALARHRVRWVLCGSEVLRLHGADLTPNDLDVVPDLAPDNLGRLAGCLSELQAVAAYLEGWGGARGTLQACRDWRPSPATADHLDWLLVTRFGMLDIVVAKAEPYDILMQGASHYLAAGVPYMACDPRRVLAALEGRTRAKDRARAGIYADLRRRLGMPATEAG